MLLDELINTNKRIYVIGAHPDDIEFSAGRLILRRKAKNTYALCLTDGQKGQEGTPGKNIETTKYMILRQKESASALYELGISPDNMFFLNIPDQELVKNPYAIDKIALYIIRLKPDLVLVPPFEGAHPDHDAAHLFSVIAARNTGFKGIVEYASYNYYQEVFRVQEFIPTEVEEHVLVPTPKEQKRWKQVMRIFKSQKNQQKYYIPKSIDEKYRLLPEYDYSKLPYESRTAKILRELLNPVYNIAKKAIPKKMYYETWSKVNPLNVKRALGSHINEYRLK